MKLEVVGGGAWGTALAQVISADSQDTLLWALEPEVVTAINGHRENPVFLAGIALNDSIQATGDLTALLQCEALLVVTPAQHTRSLLEQLPGWDRPLILCAKGIEERSGKLLHEVAEESCPAAAVAVLSGPTFAHEVAKGLPTAVTLAAADVELAERLRERIARPTFRTYVSDDVAGAEIGGAVKNVLAIACGVVEGKGLGQNARAALIARGFAEMRRFGLACGAKRETSFRPFWARRPRPHLLVNQLAQLFARGRYWREPSCHRAALQPQDRRGRRLHRARARAAGAREAGRYADRERGRCAGRGARERRSSARPVAVAAPKSRNGLEIDRDPVLLPVAVASWIEPPILAARRRSFDGLRFWDRRGGPEVGRRLDVLRAFHACKMRAMRPNAKR